MNPDWHDYPTEPGDWVMTWVRFEYKPSLQHSVISVRAMLEGGNALYSHNGQLIPVPRTDGPEHITYRYYGPLPHDPQGETN